ncbi:hypothetical protein HMEPL2_20930 [Vreelandella aquamarina]|uniref:Uncharacterized protein n=1 Tax=Vreelandella aquamarina TaxID=77097 RepID=A0A6F8XC22_9GAMM|nr:hypothetical protein HMEPL2_20930 [Halomonas meridiana]
MNIPELLRLLHKLIRLGIIAKVNFLALRLTPYALRLTPYALRLTPYALRLTPYALRLTPYALRRRQHIQKLQPQRRGGQRGNIAVVVGGVDFH